MKARYGLPIIFLVSFLISYIPGCMRNNKTYKQAQEIAQKLVSQSFDLSEGQHQITVPDFDLWNQQFRATLNIGQYGKSAVVTSGGHDLIQGTDDDISATSTYTDVSQIIGDTVESGSRRVGKGLIEGVIDGVRNKKK